MEKYTGAEGAEIELELAASWTANYRNHSTSPNTIKAHMFGNNIIDALLGQKGCVGIRMYYALDDAGVKQLILVGVDAEGRDLEEGIVADRSRVCPPDCGTVSRISTGSIIRKS